MMAAETGPFDEVAQKGLPGMPVLTDDQAKELIRYANQCGDSRKQAQGETMSEADYIAGCMAFLQALGLWGKLPGGWLFLPMIGEDVFEPKIEGPSPLERARTQIDELHQRLWRYEERYGPLPSDRARRAGSGLSEEDEELLSGDQSAPLQ